MLYSTSVYAVPVFVFKVNYALTSYQLLQDLCCKLLKLCSKAVYHRLCALFRKPIPRQAPLQLSSLDRSCRVFFLVSFVLGWLLTLRADVLSKASLYVTSCCGLKYFFLLSLFVSKLLVLSLLIDLLSLVWCFRFHLLTR